MMNRNIVAVALVLLGLACLSQSKLIFEDDFNTLDFNKWKHDITLSGGGNWEFELYDNNRSTTFVKDSKLNIKPILTEDKIGAENVRNGYTYSLWGGAPADYCTANSFYGCERRSDGMHYINPVMSGKLTTVESLSIKYGRVEVKAKLPKGNWLWPAIWMLPKHNEYASWPASGEIDIMESRGNVDYPAGGVDSFASTMHWGPDFFTNQYAKTHAEYKLASGLLSDDFHTYGLYWDDKQIYTYIDSESNKVLQVNHSDISYWDRSKITNRENPWQYSPNKCAPFDTEFYLIINLAVGGTNGYFPDGVAGKPWSDHS
jgi:beta-glucanase (GH16 family)